MTLRKKTLGIIGLTSIGLIIALYVVTNLIVLDGFVEREEQAAQQSVMRVLGTIQDDLATLEGTTHDWAAWDDTYAFVQDGNDACYKSNLLADTPLTSNRLSLMLFLDASGQVVFGKAYDNTEAKPLTLPDGLYSHLSPDDALVRHSSLSSVVKGIVKLPQGPMLVVSEPIITSAETGPVRGTLIFGRFLSSAELARLSQKTGYTLTLYPADVTGSTDVPADFQTALQSLLGAAQTSNPQPLAPNTHAFGQPLGPETIAGYALFRDIYGQPAYVLRAEMPREIYMRGQETVRYFMLTLAGVGLVFSAVAMLLLERLVLRRLRSLGASVSRVGAGGDLSARVAMPGEDELSKLAGDINGMLETLEHSHRNLRESEERYRAVMEQASEGMYIVDVNTKRVLEANTACQQLLGYSADEMLGLMLYDIIAHDRESIDHNARLIVETRSGQIGERQYRRKDGSLVDVEVSASLITYGGREVFCIVVRDITEARRASEALRRQNQELAALHETTLGLINRLDMESLLEVILLRAIALLGTEHGYLYIVDPASDELVIHVGTGAFAPNSGYRLRRGDGVGGRVWETGEPFAVDDYSAWLGRRVDLDGMQIHAIVGIPLKSGVEVMGVIGLAHFEEGRTIAPDEIELLSRFGRLASLALENARLYSAAQQELAERKRVEEALEKERDFVSAVVDTAGTFVTVVDRQGHFVRFNSASEQISGYTFDEVKGIPFWDVLILPEEREHVKEVMGGVVGGQFPNHNENYWLTKSGEKRLISWANIGLLDGEGAVEFIVSTGIDITEQRVAEAALRSSEQRYRSLFDAAERQTRELALLDQVRTALTRELDPPVVFRTVVEAIASTFGYALVSLYLIEGESLVMQHQIGYDQPVSRFPLSKGIMSLVAHTGKPRLIEDVRTEPIFISAHDGVMSEVCVPLFDEDKVVGVLNVESKLGTVLSGADLNLMVALSEHISIALGRARLYAEVRESEKRYRTVVDHVKEVIFQADEQHAWTFLNPAWTDITGFSVEDSLQEALLGYIHLDDREQAMVQFRALTEGVKENCRLEMRCLTSDGNFRWVEVYARANVSPDGVVTGTSGTLDDITERKRAEDALRELAIRDGLTGLYNRREMERLLTEDIKRYERYGGHLALVMLDIDHFKVVNDTYGHQVGDDVLKWIAQILRDNLRSVDRLARYGGEELAIILPETTQDAAFALAETLRQIVASQPFVVEAGSEQLVEIPITISLGVAAIPGTAHTEETLIAAADTALYEAKRQGRNRSIQAGELRITRQLTPVAG